MDAELRIRDALIAAIRRLPDKAEGLIHRAAMEETHPSGRLVLNAIEENIKVSAETGLPLCQDTGMFWCLASIGRDSGVFMAKVEDAVVKGAGMAAIDGFYRKSVVRDPVYSRVNTGTNLPPVIVFENIDGGDVVLHFLLKGFGSENCSGVRMLNPTAGEDGVVGAFIASRSEDYDVVFVASFQHFVFNGCVSSPPGTADDTGAIVGCPGNAVIAAVYDAGILGMVGCNA